MTRDPRKPAPYPEAFFIAHKRFTGLPFQVSGEWGDILDGPMDDEEQVIEAIIEAWKDSEFGPARDDLRVWHIVPNQPAEDVTAWAVSTVYETLEDRMGGVV